MGSASDLKDFFISYTGTDVDWAEWIAEQLEAAGYTTVYQKRDFNAGGNFVAQMHQAMRQTKRTIAVLSPEYLEARFTLSEWAEAFRRDPTGEYARAGAGAGEPLRGRWRAGRDCLYRSGGAGRQRRQTSDWWRRLAWRPASRCPRRQLCQPKARRPCQRR